jgi:hypothetical protein
VDEMIERIRMKLKSVGRFSPEMKRSLKLPEVTKLYHRI